MYAYYNTIIYKIGLLKQVCTFSNRFNNKLFLSFRCNRYNHIKNKNKCVSPASPMNKN